MEGKFRCVKGWNWGEIDVSEDDIVMRTNELDWIKLPHSSITNIIKPTKNEINFEFNVDEEQMFSFNQ